MRGLNIYSSITTLLISFVEVDHVIWFKVSGPSDFSNKPILHCSFKAGLMRQFPTRGSEIGATVAPQYLYERKKTALGVEGEGVLTFGYIFVYFLDQANQHL